MTLCDGFAKAAHLSSSSLALPVPNVNINDSFCNHIYGFVKKINNIVVSFAESPTEVI